MRELKRHRSRICCLLLPWAAACFASGAAPAQVKTTSSVPATYFAVQQPVDVCTDTGTGCAFINNKVQTVLSAPTRACYTVSIENARICSSGSSIQ